MKVKVVFRMGVMLFWILATGCKDTTDNPELATASFASTDLSYPTSETPQASDLDQTANTVYVCQSTGAKKYHYSANCRGLSNCKHEIVKMEKGDAENRGLGLCGWED